MQAHQQRVIDEKRELDVKRVKLNDFIQHNPTYREVPAHEQARLVRQLEAMNLYAGALQERIAEFPPEQPTYTPPGPGHVQITKQLRVDLDAILQRLKEAALPPPPGTSGLSLFHRSSRERSIAVTKLQEAIMWLGMDLKGLKEAGLSDEPNPYPQSYNPANGTVEPTAQGLKL